MLGVITWAIIASMMAVIGWALFAAADQTCDETQEENKELKKVVNEAADGIRHLQDKIKKKNQELIDVCEQKNKLKKENKKLRKKLGIKKKKKVKIPETETQIEIIQTAQNKENPNDWAQIKF